MSPDPDRVVNGHSAARPVSATLAGSDGTSATVMPLASPKGRLDNKPQLKGRMTPTRAGREVRVLRHAAVIGQDP